MADTLSVASAIATPRRGLALSERRVLLGAIDLAAVAAAFVAAFNLHTAEVRHAGFYVPRAGLVITLAIYAVSARLCDAWDLRSLARWTSTLRVLGTTLSCSLLGLLGVFFLTPYSVTRATLLLWLPLAAGGTLVGRRLYARTLTGVDSAVRIALVVRRDGLERVWPAVRAQLGTLYRVVGVIDPERPDCDERLCRLAASRGVDQVVLGVRDDVSRTLFRGVVRCHEAGLTVRSLADLYEELTGRLLLDQLGHTWLMSLPMRSHTSRFYAAAKRTIDVCVGAAGLLALAVVLPPVALAIKLEDGGPIFHRQNRVGQYGRTFTMYKLRTMRVASGGSTHWTEKADSRVTRVGHALRRLHLDELPQLVTILRGEMSLVGPRPEQPHYVERLRGEIDFYNSRQTVRPGLTGWAQVSHGYGDGVDGARTKLSYDLYYIKHQSVSFDVLILARTVMAVLSLNGR